jgi:hypothetical protein
MPELLDAITVTLAVGVAYAEQAATWLGPFVRAGNTALAVTDQPAIITAAGAEPLPYTPDGTHIVHAKRHAVRAGLERAETVYYLDADQVPYTRQPMPRLLRLPPGAGSYEAVRSLPMMGFVPAQTSATRATLDRMAAHMDVADWQTLRWWGDWLFTVSRDEANAWKQFCSAWDRFATFAANEHGAYSLLLGDGMAMAFAARVCGWIPHCETEALAPIPRLLQHLFFGGWEISNAAVPPTRVVLPSKV